MNEPESEITRTEPELPEGAIVGGRGGWIKPGSNPRSGRPKGSLSLIGLIREELERNDKEGAKKLAQEIVKQAAQGNATALKQIMDRLDGPIVEQLETELRITVKHEDGISEEE